MRTCERVNAISRKLPWESIAKAIPNGANPKPLLLVECFVMKNATFLSAQLRESAPYLRDAGWRETANLLVAAADEIETMRHQLGEKGDIPITHSATFEVGVRSKMARRN